MPQVSMTQDNNASPECLINNINALRFMFRGSCCVLLSILPVDKHLSFTFIFIGVFLLVVGLVRFRIGSNIHPTLRYFLATLILLLTILQFAINSLPWSFFDRETNVFMLLAFLLSKYSVFIIVTVLALIMGEWMKQVCLELEEKDIGSWDSNYRMMSSNASEGWSSLQKTAVVFVILPCVFLLLFYSRFLLDREFSFDDYVFFSRNGNVEYAEHLLVFVILPGMAPYITGIHLSLMLKRMITLSKSLKSVGIQLVLPVKVQRFLPSQKTEDSEPISEENLKSEQFDTKRSVDNLDEK